MTMPGSNDPSTTGLNVVVGASAMAGTYSANKNNTILGYLAGTYRADGVSLVGLYESVYIGAFTKSGGVGTNPSNEIVIGYNTIGGGTNTTTIGSTNTQHTFIPAGTLNVNTTVANGDAVNVEGIVSASLGFKANNQQGISGDINVGGQTFHFEMGILTSIFP